MRLFMPVDAFSVLVAFLAALEGALGVVLFVLGLRDAAETRRAAAPAEGDDRRPLLAATGVAVAVASWPLHYLLLDSWVARWPGIMCVEGVRRIGTGSLGPA